MCFFKFATICCRYKWKGTWLSTWRCNMKISSFNVEQRAASAYQKVEKNVVEVNIQTLNVEDALDISDQGLQLAEAEAEFEDLLTEEDKRKIDLLETFIYWLTGKKFKFSSIASATDEPPSTGAQNGIQIFRSQEVHEKETMSFSSSGSIKTADGQSIDFDFNMHMSRETYYKYEEQINIGGFHDPLVFNFDGKGVDFSRKKIKMDLDLDGRMDEFNFLSKGSGFLALDKNKNGKVDSGLELFGPQTNRGFKELAAYDEDGNFWIDENDEIFDSLKIWTVDDSGEETLIGLQEAGIGAIYLNDVNGSYTFKDGQQDLGRITSSSIYLRENGKVGAIHEMDIKI